MEADIKTIPEYVEEVGRKVNQVINNVMPLPSCPIARVKMEDARERVRRQLGQQLIGIGPEKSVDKVGPSQIKN